MVRRNLFRGFEPVNYFTGLEIDKNEYPDINKSSINKVAYAAIENH